MTTWIYIVNRVISTICIKMQSTRIIKYVAKNLRKKKVGYYKAVLMYSLKLKRKEVFIGPHIKSHKAIQRVILNQSVWSTSEERAYNLAHSVTSREPLHHRDGDKKKQPGKYNHYHAKSKYLFSL